MIFLLYSETNTENLNKNLGISEYSYFFVCEYFRAMLERFGATVVRIADPEEEADKLWDEAQRNGEKCVFLSFAPPHRTFMNIRCPTIPIFAWEFDTLPNEVWGGDKRNDWRYVLTKLGQAITHSRYSLGAVKQAMGEQFPALAIPAPVFDRINSGVRRSGFRGEFVVSGEVLDSRHSEDWAVVPAPPPPPPPPPSPPSTVPETRSLARRVKLTAVYVLMWYRDVVRDLLPAFVKNGVSLLGQGFYRAVYAYRFKPAMRPETTAVKEPAAPPPLITPPPAPLTRLALDGVVYTSVFNPADGRKNWLEILTAFCCALSAQEDATLVFKFANADCAGAMDVVRDNLRKLPPFKCRVVVLSGFLDENAYCELIAASTYTVNNSLAEGQCLPLMEYLSAGKPAIAPRNTALIDYIDEEIAFVLKSSRELCCWPQDSRHMYRAHRYRGDWQSLVDAIGASYRVAKAEPERYDAMSRVATERMRGYCSQQAVWEKFSAFVEQCFPAQSKAPAEERTVQPAQCA